MSKHESLGNEVTPQGVVHKCSCGWVSRPCFSSVIASGEGIDHLTDAEVARTVEGKDQ